MKDIYIIMNRQNILNFYGSKLDLKLDSSELYDYQLTTNEVDYDTDVLDLSIPITYSALTIDSSCLITNLNDQKPWIVPIDSHYTGDTCDFTVRRRTEKGWTLDFVFNREGNNWSEGKVFYYLGTDDNSGLLNYLDNNLSFQFTNDGKIKWVAHRYSGYCDNSSSYIGTHYMSDDETSPLCVIDNNKDFNLTIVFNRNKEYDGCDLENEGGFNDLIQGPHAVEFIKPLTGVTGMTSTQIVTGYTITNTIQDWVTGGTITTQYIEELNKKWSDERDKRLGDLKIYLNGNLIYTKHNWEEVIPSYRNNQTIIQSWGGGQDYSWFGSYSTCGFNMKSIKYYEEPLDFVHVKHNFRTLTGYTFEICNAPCVDDVYKYVPPTATPTPVPTSTPTPTPTPTSVPPTPTPTPTPTSTPTNTPTPTPSPTYLIEPTGFTFDFDYMVVDYYFTNGNDMDTQTYISRPSIMSFSDVYNEGYVGTCGQSDSRVYFPNSVNPIISYGGDNHDTSGVESILFDLTQFKLQYTGNTIELTFTAIWFFTGSPDPVSLRATFYKGGFMYQDGYTFRNDNPTNSKLVMSEGKVITSENIKTCVPFEEVGKFRYNLISTYGQFV